MVVLPSEKRRRLQARRCPFFVASSCDAEPGKGAPGKAASCEGASDKATSGTASSAITVSVETQPPVRAQKCATRDRQQDRRSSPFFENYDTTS